MLKSIVVDTTKLKKSTKVKNDITYDEQDRFLELLKMCLKDGSLVIEPSRKYSNAIDIVINNKTVNEDYD